MVKINGKKFKLYDLDTVDTIISRIAVNFETIPKYLYFSEGIPKNFRDVREISVDNILEFIKSNASESTDFKKFIKKFLKKYPNMSLDIKKDLLEVWLSYNTQLEQIADFDTSILVSTGDEIAKEGYFKDEKDFQNFWNNERDGKKREIEDDISRHNEQTKGSIDLYKIFDEITEEDEIGYTDFNIEQVKLEIVLDLEGITVLEIFNHIKNNETIPFASCKNYYKILKDFVPPEEWAEKTKGRTLVNRHKVLENEDNCIFLKMYEKEKIKVKNYKDFTDIKIEVGEVVRASMKLKIEKGYLSQEKFIERFKSIFVGLDLKSREINETGVVGVFYFPSQLFNTYVFSDLVMNDPNFEKLINIDESQKATKRKVEGKNPLLNIHFSHQSTGNIRASIIQKFVDKTDPEMRNQDREIFPEDEEYIRIRVVRGRDTESIKVFQKIFSKLLFIYSQKHGDIVEFYKQFIPDFGQVVKLQKVLTIKKDLKRAVPELFLSNYTRKCLNSPDIITPEEAQGLDEGKSIVFPRDLQQGGVQYTSDGKNQHYYKCTDPAYPYTGVQVNKLSNKDEFPYIPCCFKENQSEKKGGSYNIYYRNEEKEVREKKQQDFITTNKFVNNNQFGTLPQDLETFLKLIDPLEDPNITYEYVRIGVSNDETTGKHSFIKAVMLGLQEYLDITYSTDSQFEKKVSDVIERLSSENFATIARQSMYDYTTEEIIANILDKESYLQPRYYTQLLETFFNCNIFVFKKTDNETRPVVPRHIQGYYKYNMKKTPSVFIYEHLGSESDNASDYRCELIVKWKKGDKQGTEYFFQNTTIISRNMTRFFNLLNQTYSLDKKIFDISFKLNLELVSQYIDSYGKTRLVNVNYKGHYISIITSPIPPLNIKEEKSLQILKTTKITALDLFNHLKTEVDTQTVSSSLQEINGTFGIVQITIPIDDDKDNSSLQDIPLNNSGLHFPDSNSSTLEIYNKNKKISRCIKEYTLWLFSKYMKNKQTVQQVISDNLIADFVKDIITIKPFTYEIVPKTFSTKSKLMENKKLIVSSEELLKRLLYFLKLYSVRNFESLTTYYTHTVISDYYVDITDFDTFQGQVILQGEDSIDKWIQESKFKYTIYNSIITGQLSPYFFKNNKINSGQVFLAQNSLSLEQTVSISVYWQQNGYNIGIKEEFTQSKDYEFYLFLYGDQDNITKFKISGDKKLPNDINIIIAKISNITFYISLLTL
jgi:hypothetical protein